MESLRKILLTLASVLLVLILVFFYLTFLSVLLWALSDSGEGGFWVDTTYLLFNITLILLGISQIYTFFKINSESNSEGLFYLFTTLVVLSSFTFIMLQMIEFHQSHKYPIIYKIGLLSRNTALNVVGSTSGLALFGIGGGYFNFWWWKRYTKLKKENK